MTNSANAKRRNYWSHDVICSLRNTTCCRTRFTRPRYGFIKLWPKFIFLV